MKKKILRREVPETSCFGEEHTQVIERVFAARGVQSQSEIDYNLRNMLPPHNLRGLPEAIDLLIEARNQQQKILVVGDFDADGATSTALMLRCMKSLGFESINFLVPNRFEFGYGLTPEIVELAVSYEPEILITVDNGISSYAGVAKAKTLGITVIVTDHHLPGDRLPEADAIVNPNQPGCEFVGKNSAGVGVAFYLMMALRARMRELDFFTDGPEPNFANFLDLVALGTVADVVPLDRNNRLLVYQGLERIKAGRMCPGIRAILKVAGREDFAKIGSSDLGFIVGPRLNAAGRLDDMSLGIRCLLADDDSQAIQIAAELDALNRERRAIEGSMQKEAQRDLAELFEEHEGSLPSGVCVYRQDWHQGVIGILASRIKEQYHRPTIVFADDRSDYLKGSGRSIPGLHLRDALDQIAKRAPDILNKFGGHAMAAGMTIAKKDLTDFSSLFATTVEELLEPHALEPVIYTDGELQPQQLNLLLAEQLGRAGPWGQAFPEPCFDGEFYIVNQRIVGDKHLKLTLACDSNTSYIVDAIAFNIDLEQWPDPNCECVKVVYKLLINSFRGNETVQLVVDYIEKID